MKIIDSINYAYTDYCICEKKRLLYLRVFLGQVLFTMWQHQELRDVYKKHGWKEQDFVTKTVAARNSGPNSPNNANR